MQLYASVRTQGVFSLLPIAMLLLILQMLKNRWWFNGRRYKWIHSTGATYLIVGKPLTFMMGYVAKKEFGISKSQICMVGFGQNFGCKMLLVLSDISTGKGYSLLQQQKYNARERKRKHRILTRLGPTGAYVLASRFFL